jgi:hypothetical protein
MPFSIAATAKDSVVVVLIVATVVLAAVADYTGGDVTEKLSWIFGTGALTLVGVREKKETK